MSTIQALSDQAVELHSALDPIEATRRGVAGHNHEWPDLSPRGRSQTRESLASLRREALDAVCDTPAEELSRRVLVEHGDTIIDAIDAGDHLCEINSIRCPHQTIRQVFDYMPSQTPEHWHDIATRLETIHEPVAGYRASLDEGRRQGRVAARRQVEAVIDQGRIAAGEDSPFRALLAARPPGLDAETAARVDRGVAHARSVFAELTDHLHDEYLPAARTADGEGAEVYERATRRWLGTTIDIDDTYRWGWSEIERLGAELERECATIDPDRTTAEVTELLQTDPNRAATSLEEYVEVMTARQHRARDAVLDVHFELPQELRPIEVKVEAPGGAVSPHYIPAAEDGSRPGTVWYPVAGRTFFPLFAEITMAYHEGYPGHHLQVATQQARSGELTRFQRRVAWTSGSGEGWALYAEQFMDEIGEFELPDYRVGLLSSQLFRSCRIVIDLGIHLGLAIPDDSTFHPGERWTAELAQELLEQRALIAPATAHDEVRRYCGWPGQAISYKVGERAILDLRDEARRRPRFDLKSFHADVLAAGAVGLDALRDTVRAGW